MGANAAKERTLLQREYHHNVSAQKAMATGDAHGYQRHVREAHNAAHKADVNHSKMFKNGNALTPFARHPAPLPELLNGSTAPVGDGRYSNGGILSAPAPLSTIAGPPTSHATHVQPQAAFAPQGPTFMEPAAPALALPAPAYAPAYAPTAYPAIAAAPSAIGAYPAAAAYPAITAGPSYPAF